MIVGDSTRVRRQEPRIQELLEDADQHTSTAAMQGRGRGIRGFVEQLCGEGCIWGMRTLRCFHSQCNTDFRLYSSRKPRRNVGRLSSSKHKTVSRILNGFNSRCLHRRRVSCYCCFSRIQPAAVCAPTTSALPGTPATSPTWQCGPQNPHSHGGWRQPLPRREPLHGLTGFTTERPWDRGSKPHRMAEQSGNTCDLNHAVPLNPLGPSWTRWWWGMACTWAEKELAFLPTAWNRQ